MNNCRKPSQDSSTSQPSNHVNSFLSPSSVLEKPARSGKANRPRPVCQVCGRSFSKPANLRAHERIHTGEKRYSCAICQRRFVWKSSLNFHSRTAHKDLNDVKPNDIPVEVHQSPISPALSITPPQHPPLQQYDTAIPSPYSISDSLSPPSLLPEVVPGTDSCTPQPPPTPQTPQTPHTPVVFENVFHRVDDSHILPNVNEGIPTLLGFWDDDSILTEVENQQPPGDLSSLLLMSDFEMDAVITGSALDILSPDGTASGEDLLNFF